MELNTRTGHVVLHDNSDPPTRVRRIGRFQKCSTFIIASLERFFYNWGFNIANRPWIYIISCIIFTMICSIGLIGFTPENRPDKLWIPWNSNFVKNSDWLRDNFPSPIRFHFVIITAENVLEPRVIQMLQDIHERVKELKVRGMEYSRWTDVCFKLPVTKFSNRRKRSYRRRDVQGFDEDEDFFNEKSNSTPNETETESRTKSYYDPSFAIGQETYCELLSSLEEECWESNFAELWNYDHVQISDVSTQDILAKINDKQISPVFGQPVDYSKELGGITRDSDGQIVSAKAIKIQWFGKINQTALNEGKRENDLGTGETVDLVNLRWETELSHFLNNYSMSLPKDIKLDFSIARSFGDISGATIRGDASMFAVGFSIVFIYVIFMLGKFNVVEQRPLLSLVGLSSVGLAILVSYGICSAFGAIYGPVHNILPFLLLGIGIDDMFVIMQCWNNLTPDEKTRKLPEKMGLTLKHAGVSITVTSLTDFVAFAIGASTVLPALQTFCMYAALGIFATYVFQATFFVAFFVLDERRIESKRNAFAIWYKHKDFVPSQCSQKNWAQICFERVYSRILLKMCTKILVFILTGILLGGNIYGNMKLRQEFNPIWFLPQDSYLFKYFMTRDKYFPDSGDGGLIIMSNLSYPDKLKDIDDMMQQLDQFPYIHDIESWHEDYKEYVRFNYKKDALLATSKSEFQKTLGRFLFSPVGSKYRARIKFNGNLTCGFPAPPLLISSIGFKFQIFKDSDQHIPVMNELRSIVRNLNLTDEHGSAFVWSFAFAGWETDEIITVELFRNVALAMVCVLITTLILIANLKTCLMVLACVVLTLIDVCGSMHFWDLTIDTVSCINLVMAIGLCVDYAAHIAHAFMKYEGSRNERAKGALTSIGPAVLNGGFSTFLAFVLLANSKSYVFISFYKIFFLVVTYGLYHGLVFLPVLLSIIGPESYASQIYFHEDNKIRIASSPSQELKDDALNKRNSHPSNEREEDRGIPYIDE